MPDVSLARRTIEAAITHLAQVAGWPVAVSALRVLDETWQEMDAQEASGETG